MIFLTHCHYDHTGGLLPLLEAIDKPVPVVAHPDLFRASYATSPCLRSIDTPPELQEDLAGLDAQLLLVRNPFPLMDGLWSTGEVERTTAFEPAGIGTYNLVDACLVPDELQDDLSLVANVKDKGLVIITGCSHAGIVNIVRQAQKLTGIERIAGIIGGLHLINATQERIAATVAALAELNPTWVAAGHCTGFAASCALAQALGSRFKPLTAGTQIDV